MQMAEEIAQKFTIHSEIEKVEAVKPGFVNFWLADEYLSHNMEEVLKNPEEAGKSETLKNKKIMVEFTDPNPFKEFHIGHLYSNIVGESICRLLESQGAEVKRVCYQGDVGMHVAKAIFGISRKLRTESVKLRILEEKSLKEKAKFLGQAYALGATAYEENEKAKQEIIAINKKVYTKEDSQINELYEKGKDWSLAYFDRIYHRLGTRFWKLYFESEVGVIGLAYVEKYLGKGIFTENDGAVIFEGEQYGLHTRVFINSLGLPTYEAKELGLAPTKYKDFPYDKSIILTGNEINEYFKVLLQVLELINPDLAKKTKHISHGMVRLPEGKMSSRTGNVITGEWLLDEAKEKTVKKIQEVKHIGEQFNQDRDTIADQVGIGAVKYALLKSSIGRDIEFDFDTSITFDGNSGPYIQYAYVRTQSILTKAKTHPLPPPEEGRKETISPPAEGTKGRVLVEKMKKYKVQPEELILLRLLTRFSSIVQQSADTLSPNTLCNYLYELAKQFNLFYQTYRIADALTAEEIAFRLHLTQATGTILHGGLSFLGIAAPEKM